jgi:ComF family protein
MRWLTSLAEACLDLVLPPRCAACAAAPEVEGVWCAACAQSLLPAPRGDRSSRAVHAYGGQIAVAIQRLKYAGAAELGPQLGRLLCALRPSDPRSLVVPVPLHRRRLWQRGYNQAALLARPLARSGGGLELATRALGRVRATLPQTDLDAAARWRNVRGAFVADPRRVAGRAVALVDDVLTTGATARACSEALYAAGARSVEVLTLARRAQGMQ